MADLGKRNILPIIRESDHGYLLDAGELGEVLLRRQQIPREVRLEGSVEVFLFCDNDGRLVATLETPLALVGDFASLRVMDVIRDEGAILAWGLQQELMLPFSEQEQAIEAGDFVVVYIALDSETGQIYATNRLSNHLSTEPPPFKVGQPVDLMVVRETPLGYIALVEETALGLLYHSNLNELLSPGQKLEGYIGAIRPDGKIDLTLDSSGYHRVNSLTDQIVAELKACGGSIDLDDESTPEAIRAAFGASKKAFKQAVGSLYKQRRIRFTKPGIALLN